MVGTALSTREAALLGLAEMGAVNWNEDNKIEEQMREFRDCMDLTSRLLCYMHTWLFCAFTGAKSNVLSCHR